MTQIAATVRRRIVVLLFIAALPLFAMAALIAYQNSALVAERVRQGVIATRVSVQIRQRAFLSEGERLLAAIALSADTLSSNPSICAARLSRLVSVAGERYLSLRLFDSRGELLCGSAASPATLTTTDATALDRAKESGEFAIGTVSPGYPGGPLVLPIAQPMRPRLDGEVSPGIILATLNVGRLLSGVDGSAPPHGLRVWLLPPSGPAVSLTSTGEEDLPDAAQLSRLADARDMVSPAPGANAEGLVYALGDLPAGMRVLVAQPATTSLATADLVLGRRIAELGLVLLTGLAVVALGADLTIGRPLNRVARAVARWRAGGRFEPGPLRAAPDEVAELARSFAEAATALRVREEQLRDGAARQELLMQEIHHRVKNNLQVVASLLNLQAGRIRQPEARAEFHAARDRIRALATLHRHLYAHGELQTINMRGFLEELCHQLMQAMGETPGGGRIALTIEASELRISSDQAVPIALLVTETVSNAVKYAFPGGRSGHIAVRLTTSRDGSGREIARLSIEDDGVGIPAGRAETESGTRDGLGLQLIRGFSRQLGANLQVHQDHGTHYIVDLPLQQEGRVDLPPTDDALSEDRA